MPPPGAATPPPPPSPHRSVSVSGPDAPASPAPDPKSPRAGAAPLALAASAGAAPAPPPPVRVDAAFPAGGRPVGVGLSNLGNSCFMNAVLQALVHTPPLANALLASRLECCGSDTCAHCLLAARVAASLSPSTASPDAPRALFRALPSLARTLTCGRQEDAHEFLRAALDAADRARRAGLAAAGRLPLPGWASEVEAAFKGSLRSRVTCGRCGGASDTVDPFLDLALDPGAGDVDGCLRAWAAPEILAGGDAYSCARCGPVPAAAKALSVAAAPASLVLTLKRFRGLHGKDTRHVAFGETLTPPESVHARPGGARPPPPPTYSLAAVVVHAGSSATCGHYFAFVRARDGRWWRADDAWVAPADATTVLASCAYMLVYVHDGGAAAAKGTAAAAAAAPAPSPARARAPSPPPPAVSPTDALKPPAPPRPLWRPSPRLPSLAAQVAATPPPARTAPRAVPPPPPRSLTKRQVGGFRSRGAAMLAAASGVGFPSPASGERRRPASASGADALTGSVEKRLRHE